MCLGLAVWRKHNIKWEIKEYMPAVRVENTASIPVFQTARVLVDATSHLSVLTPQLRVNFCSDDVWYTPPPPEPTLVHGMICTYAIVAQRKRSRDVGRRADLWKGCNPNGGAVDKRRGSGRDSSEVSEQM